MKKGIALGLIGLSVVSVGAVSATAFGGMGPSNPVLEDALSSGNYDAFVDEVSQLEGKFSDISEEQFEMMSERFIEREAAQTAIESNDYEAFLEATEGSPRGELSEEEFSELVARFQAHESAKEAIENEDYAAWVSAVSELPFGEDLIEMVTEEEFSTFVELHEAKEARDFETARELADEIGLEKPTSHKPHTHKPHLGRGFN